MEWYKKINNIIQFIIVSVKPHLKITNQKSSGRCWLFAALNVVRREICLKYNLSDFEFSQSHLFFWDKLERMNYNLECIIQTRAQDINSRLVQHLLGDPTCDGGQWDMITNSVNKYVGQFLNKKTRRMDRDNVSYLKLLGLSFTLNKEQRLNYNDSLMTHAMVITGANVSETDSLVKAALIVGKLKIHGQIMVQPMDITV